MNDTWESQFVDRQMGRAWLELRMQLADRFASALAAGGMEPLDISTATGETLTVDIDVHDNQVVIIAGDEVYTTENVDEAAFTVFHVLHDEWQVVHPSFLDSEAVEVPNVEEAPAKTPVPVLGKATSKEQLQEWVVATFNADRDQPVKVAPNGDVAWRTRGGKRVVVRVHNAGRIDFVSVIAQRVSFTKAHKVMDELSRKFFGLKFFLVQDTLLVSQIVIAHPYSGEQVTRALGTFMSNVDELAWVSERLESKRAKVDREAMNALKEAHTLALETLEEATAELEARAGQVESLESERDAAKAELARMKRFLERALGHQTFRGRTGRGEAA